MPHIPLGPLATPAGVSCCSPEVLVSSSTEFLLASTAKASNFIQGELVAGILVFLVENLPKETPRTGCPGAWMFGRMMEHFDPDVAAIQGTWVDPARSDNLIAVNRLTAGGMSLEDAASRTWTGQQAAGHGFTAVEIAAPPAGSPGKYTDVRVRFRRPGGGHADAT